MDKFGFFWGGGEEWFHDGIIFSFVLYKVLRVSRIDQCGSPLLADCWIGHDVGVIRVVLFVNKSENDVLHVCQSRDSCHRSGIW